MAPFGVGILRIFFDESRWHIPLRGRDLQSSTYGETRRRVRDVIATRAVVMIALTREDALRHLAQLWLLDDRHALAVYGRALVPLRALTATIIALLVTVVYALFGGVLLPVAVRTDTFWIATMFIALLLSVRLNSAITLRQSSAASVNASDELIDAGRALVSTACASMSTATVAPNEMLALLVDLKRHVLQYMAFALYKESEAALEVTQDLLENDEARVLANTQLDAAVNDRVATGIGSTNKLRAAIVELWLRRTITRGLACETLLPHQATALNTLISVLPTLHTKLLQSTCVDTTTPPRVYLAQYVKICLIVYLVLFTVTRVSVDGLATPLSVFVFGLLLFGADAIVIVLESDLPPHDHVATAQQDYVETQLLWLQDELCAILQAQVASTDDCPRDVVDRYRICRRQVPSPRSPSFRPGPDDHDGMTKPTRGSPPKTLTTESTRTTTEEDERRPLLAFSFTGRNALFRYDDTRISVAESEQTDDDDDDDDDEEQAHQLHGQTGYRAV